jgi:heme/copper-type cytochrome/quinol oxidase subunit 2
MKRLPIVLGVGHLLFACVVYTGACASPDRHGLSPLLIHWLTFPLSIVLEWLRRSVYTLIAVDTYASRLAIEAALYAVLGSAWWFGIGVVVSRAARDRNG